MMQNTVTQLGTRIRCPNMYCNYAWTYKDRLLRYATYPRCRKNVKIYENKLQALKPVEVEAPEQAIVAANVQYQGEVLIHDNA